MALTTWAAYQAAHPDKAQQLTQILMCAKGVGVNENYVFEIDPITGGIPISITPSDIQFNLNGASVVVKEDSVSPWHNNLLPVKTLGKTLANSPSIHNYTSNVTTVAYTQLVASTSALINRLQIFDSSGEVMVLAIGAIGAEQDMFYIPPGGIDIDFWIQAGTRISIKAVTNNATSGVNVINYLT